MSHQNCHRRINRKSRLEERWRALGWMKALVGVVIYTEREGDVVRVISARKATKREVSHYEKSIKD
ncbi:BrnT family toxin [Oceanicoccus sagamiensis]|uniref:BrnT family toxin n=1 Tax=Oceanicoccus sagamiensis TaxID=716816 RepID=UPI00197FA18E|nr:BrnT family toxin [Oceanicoccus sagamiensis]